MEEYELTRTNFPVNMWKKEGALIAILGALLLFGVILAGGGLMTMFFFGFLIFLGVYMFTNNKIAQDITRRYTSPSYPKQNELQLQPSQWQQIDEWETQPKWNSQQQQWQNQNIQRRQINETITKR